MPHVHQSGDRIVVEADQYVLSLSALDGTWAELKRDSAPIARLFLPGAVDTVDAEDVTLSVGAPIIRERNGSTVFTIRSQSSIWASRVTKLICRDDVVEMVLRVHGQGLLDNVRYLGGTTSTGPIHSGANFNRVFSPAPNACYRQHFDPDATAFISVHDRPDWLKGSWFFTPAPLSFCVRAAQANWMSFTVCARPGGHSFEDYVYEGSPLGFQLRLAYSGHTSCDDQWDSPVLALIGGADEYDALEAGCAWRSLCGNTPAHNAPAALWWRSPIFRGWGEQVALSLANGAQPRASDYCRQANYEAWLETLESRGLNPGIIVVDDKWQDKYGDPRPDLEKWPDLAGFIRAQHSRRRHVLLVWKAWDAEGVPADEQVQNSPWPEGSVDPSSRAYWQRLRTAVEYLIGDLDADGFKIDFTHRTPFGREAHAAGGSWGVELLRDLVAHISDAAKAVKPDALIMSQTADPYFANIIDMVCLSDTMRLDMAEQITAAEILTHMTHRARVARAASQDWLIDTDSWPNRDRDQWLGYVQRQPYLGIPSLSYATRIDRTGELLRAEDYAAVARAWETYRQRRTR